MSSNSGIKVIRQARKKKIDVKIVVLGAPRVGKSALTVRFLTRRYIGEYDHQADSRYKHEVTLDGEPVSCEICDSCTKCTVDLPSADLLSWADGLVVVYSITDRASFTYLKQMFNHIQEVRCSQGKEKEVPMVILGNKGDMVHLRQVSSEEGEILSKDYDCNFSEVAAADQVTEVADAFHELCREVIQVRRKNKVTLLDRVLGTKNGNKVYHRGKSDSSLSKFQ